MGKIIGKITGSDDAADAQVDAANQSAALSKEQFEATEARLNPFVNYGLSMIPGLMQNMQPIDNEQALSDYYNSGEYAMMSNQANNNLMANAEAMGGMGGSTNANNLMRIAPQMGMQHLGTLNSQRMDNFNMMNSIYGSGLNAAAQTGQAGQNYASQAGAAYQQAGQAKAQGAMAPFQSMLGLGGLALGAYGAGLFGGGAAAGAAGAGAGAGAGLGGVM